MNDKPIFYDNDFLSCFLEIGEQELLFNLFSKIIIPSPVFQELTRKKSPLSVKNNLKKLINQGKVEIKDLEFSSEEYIKYLCIHKGFWTDNKPIGMGESAVLALAIVNEGIVASNNISDIFEICDDFDVPILTVPLILSKLYESNYISMEKAEELWIKMLKIQRILPKNRFAKYYEKLYKKDVVSLLKNYEL